jgi:hypothetical protein
VKLFNLRLVFAWILVIPSSFLITGFLSNFYPSFFELALSAFLCQLALAVFADYLLGRVKRLAQEQPGDFVLALTLFLGLSVFTVAAFRMAVQFPSLFDAGYFLLEKNQFTPFTLGAVIAFPFPAIGVRMAKQKRIGQTIFFRRVEENLPGLLIATFFFLVYIINASIFNRPVFDVDDIFFDSDGLLWRLRFTTGNWHDYYWRSVHPFVLLLLRPPIAFIGALLRGDRLSAAFILIALSGALCVWLAWYFVRKTVGNSIYALLAASLLGASAAHLVFGSLIETYIFLAAVILLFFVLLLDQRPFPALVLTGLTALGITITNVAQTVIALFMVRRDFRQLVKFVLIVGFLSVPLTLLNNLVYPDANPFFFVPSSLKAEADNTFAPSADRLLAITRVMFFHSVVAPDPLILKEEIPFLKVWMFKAEPLRVSGYDTPLGTFTAFFWMALMGVGGLLFLKNLKKRDNHFSLAFLLTILFNAVLHLRYGKEVFLYSANWTYALVLFLALSWKELSDKRWFQLILLLFLALELINNARLIFTMLDTSAMHIK